MRGQGSQPLVIAPHGPGSAPPSERRGWERCGPFKSRAQVARGPREPRVRRAAEELESGAKVSSQLRPRARRRTAHSSPGPAAGPAARARARARARAGLGRRFRFGGRGADTSARPGQAQEEAPATVPPRPRPPATWKLALPAAAPAPIPPAAARRRRRGATASPGPCGVSGERRPRCPGLRAPSVPREWGLRLRDQTPVRPRPARPG